MITLLVNKVKEWYAIWTDPAGWDDSDDPCPYKCHCDCKKENKNDKQN